MHIQALMDSCSYCRISLRSSLSDSYSHVHILIVIFPYSKAMFLRATPNALPRCTCVAACCSACDAACCNKLGILGMTPAVGWSLVCRAATSPPIHDSSSSWNSDDSWSSWNLGQSLNSWNLCDSSSSWGSDGYLKRQPMWWDLNGDLQC